MTTREPHPYDPSAHGPGPGPAPGAPARPRRSRLRRLLPLAVAAWVVLEVWLLTLLGDAVGPWGVVIALAAGAVLGAVAIKRAGRRAWRELSASLQSPGAAAPTASSPGRAGSNALAMLGGLLLMVPGLFSDAVGLLCLFPPTAALLRRGAGRLLGRGAFGDVGTAFEQARTAGEQVRIHRPDGKVVQGEVLREDDGPR